MGEMKASLEGTMKLKGQFTKRIDGNSREWTEVDKRKERAAAERKKGNKLGKVKYRVFTNYYPCVSSFNLF